MRLLILLVGCLVATSWLLVQHADAFDGDDDTVMVEVTDYVDELHTRLIDMDSSLESDSSMMKMNTGAPNTFPSWSMLDSPPLSVLTTSETMNLAQLDGNSLETDFSHEEASLAKGPENQATPQPLVAQEISGTDYTAGVPDDYVYIEQSGADGGDSDHTALVETQLSKIEPPHPNLNGPVTYTVSYELYIHQLHGNWANLITRGAGDNDRTPGMWTYPSSGRIHFRHASTRSWNDGCDSTRHVPVGRWTSIKGVVSHNKAWIYVDGKFDNFIDLGPNHHFTWGQKSLGFFQKGHWTNPYYKNTHSLRNFQWSNTAEPVPDDIPQPNFDAPVKYTFEFEAFVAKPYGGWSNVFERGANDGDRTPGVWLYPGSTRIHFRHQADGDWNFDCDSATSPPIGQWFSFKGVINDNRCWCYVNGLLDRVVELPKGRKFRWGQKSLGFARGPAVNPGYGPVTQRSFTWSNSAEDFPAPQPNFDKPVEYTLSVDLKQVHLPHSHWPSIFVRGRDNGDRNPGLWLMGSSGRIHIRQTSTHDWNRDLDTTTPAPIDQWFTIKVVVKHDQAWVYLDSKLDRFVQLPHGQHFTWGAKSNSFSIGSTVHPSHHNDGHTAVHYRNFKWSNTAEQLPNALPKPDFQKPVAYTLSTDVLIPKTVPNWGCIQNRGLDNSDRTPGIWTYPGSSRIHIRHHSTVNPNHECDSISHAPIGSWFNLKVVVNHNQCQAFIDGKLDRTVDLGPNHHFTWGQQSLGWAHGGAVHPSYYDVQIRNFTFSPNSTTSELPSPLESPNAAFWHARLKPTDQSPPKKAPLFIPPKGIKPPKMDLPNPVFVAPPKKVSKSKVLKVGEIPKPPKPQPKPVKVHKPKSAPPKIKIHNLMTGKVTKAKAPKKVKIPKPEPLITKENIDQFRPSDNTWEEDDEDHDADLQYELKYEIHDELDEYDI